MTDVDRAAVARALGYPYERPGGSWVLTGRTGARRARPLDGGEVGRVTAGRVAVLAIGANAAPAQLARKFDDGSWGDVPVIATALADHDVVHAARVSEYGAIPATRWRSPGTVVSVHTTFLTPAQLTRMDATEGLGLGYRRVLVDPRLVEVAGVGAPGVVHTYDAMAGALVVDGGPVALAAIGADGRALPEMDERDVLSWVAAQRGTTLDALVAGLVAPSGRPRRDELRRWLAARGVAPRP